jgi:hypothetical protein
LNRQKSERDGGHDRAIHPTTAQRCRDRRHQGYEEAGPRLGVESEFHKAFGEFCFK